MESKNTGTKVITGEGIFSYLNCWEPRAASEDATPKYSVSFIFPKTDKVTHDKIMSAMRAAYENGQSTLKGNGKVAPAFERIKLALRDGDEKYNEGGDEIYKGCWFVNASSKTAPGIVDRNRVEIIDRKEMYSGVIGRAAINFYAYNTNGNKGIAAGLNNLQKIRDGAPLGGASRAEDDFNDGYNPEDDELFE